MEKYWNLQTVGPLSCQAWNNENEYFLIVRILNFDLEEPTIVKINSIQNKAKSLHSILLSDWGIKFRTHSSGRRPANWSLNSVILRGPVLGTFLRLITMAAINYTWSGLPKVSPASRYNYLVNWSLATAGQFLTLTSHHVQLLASRGLVGGFGCLELVLYGIRELA